MLVVTVVGRLPSGGALTSERRMKFEESGSGDSRPVSVQKADCLCIDVSLSGDREDLGRDIGERHG